MREDRQHAPGSSTEAFAQSIFTQFTLDLAKDCMLAHQLLLHHPSPSLSENERWARENVFLNEEELRGAFFLRTHQHKDAVRVIVSDLAKFRFLLDSDDGLGGDSIVLRHENAQVSVRITCGLSYACELVLVATFESPTSSKEARQAVRRQFSSLRLVSMTMANSGLLRSQRHDLTTPSLTELALTEKDHFDKADSAIEDVIPLSPLFHTSYTDG